jgi:hypothetical protein
MGYFSNFMAFQYVFFSSNPAQQGWIIPISDGAPVYSEMIRQAKNIREKKWQTQVFLQELFLLTNGKWASRPARRLFRHMPSLLPRRTLGWVFVRISQTTAFHF